jgi:hypothetical protein
MNQSEINKVSKVLMIFGGVLFVFCLGAFIFSLTRPPVTSGPIPEIPVMQ